MASKRIVDVLSEEERELKACVKRMRKVVEQLEEERQVTLREIAEAKDEIIAVRQQIEIERQKLQDMVAQRMGIGKPKDDEAAKKIVKEMRKVWEERMIRQPGGRFRWDDIRWSLDETDYSASNEWNSNTPT